jgi:hypothetical protein
LNWRNCGRNVDGIAILVGAFGLIFLDVLAALQPQHDLGKLVCVTWRYQHRYRLPEDLLRFVPVYLFGPFVSTYDGAVHGFPNHGVVSIAVSRWHSLERSTGGYIAGQFSLKIHIC